YIPYYGINKSFFNSKISAHPCDVSCLPYIINGLTVVLLQVISVYLHVIFVIYEYIPVIIEDA
ncbi:hypothetical protein DTS78_18070, partial [Salmonella enterica]|nr:hypothetical protein [Salmonella enterica]